MLISFVNQKGGVGKSTLATHLVCWLKREGIKVALFDADIQASSSDWLESFDPSIPIERITPDKVERIPSQLKKLQAEADIVVADGPGGLGEVTRNLLLVSHVALFPLSPSAFDAKSLQSAREQFDYAQAMTGEKVGRIILNKVRKRSRLANEMREAEEELGLQFLKNEIRELDAFKVASMGGPVWTIGKEGASATEDLDALFGEILSLVSEEEKVGNG
jgi:chromosome partitioning protein